MTMAVVAALMTAGAAHAGKRENALKHIAQAIAAAQICSKIEVVETYILFLGGAAGVDFERDKAELLAETRRQMAPWKGENPDAACVAGMLLYGPDGENVPGLLRWK